MPKSKQEKYVLDFRKLINRNLLRVLERQSFAPMNDQLLNEFRNFLTNISLRIQCLLRMGCDDDPQMHIVLNSYLQFIQKKALSGICLPRDVIKIKVMLIFLIDEFSKNTPLSF